jgi:hypothetical protein
VDEQVKVCGLQVNPGAQPVAGSPCVSAGVQESAHALHEEVLPGAAAGHTCCSQANPPLQSESSLHAGFTVQTLVVAAQAARVPHPAPDVSVT